MFRRLPPTGYHWSGIPGGVLLAEGTVRSGIAIGTHREWYADGRPAEEKEFDDHGNQLSVRSWDENGILIEDKNFR